MKAALAPAKLNLSLRVFSPEPDGYHPLHSLIVAVDWYDEVRIAEASEDRLSIAGGPAPEGDDNIVWQAMRLLREESGSRQPVLIELTKRIPSGAGLGGGSSDAAATLLAASSLLGVAMPTSETVFSIGADVPFFVSGGLAAMSGRGEILELLTGVTDYAVAIIVPPIELATPAVFRRWDDLRGPAGPDMPFRDTPPSLRGSMALRNDLWPAALDLAPEMGEWRRELEQEWGTAVAMTGSGSGFFAFFGDRSEADEALRASNVPRRASRAAVPVAHGATLAAR